MSDPVSIIGMGLAGCTAAWQLHFRGREFTVSEDRADAAGSLVAAGMLAPVTGKAFNPSWRIEEFYRTAREFYALVEAELGVTLWYDYPVVRLFFDEKDREKLERRRADNPALNKWVSEVVDSVPHADASYGAVVWKGGGRLNVGAFVERTREFFSDRLASASLDGRKAYTTGARGLVDQNPVALPHRSAKGEIITVRVPGLSEGQIISRGSWLVPTGNDDQTFLCGANYDWDALDNQPTPSGLAAAEKGLRSLTSLPYEVVAHVAGVRPIVRRSEPVIKEVEGGYYLNGLGSKGTLYAPKAVEYMLGALCDGKPVPEHLQLNTP